MIHVNFIVIPNGISQVYDTSVSAQNKQHKQLRTFKNRK